jgi:phosphotriesterase-related protein
VGRNVVILKYLAERTGIKIIAPTGVYREAFTPTRLLDVSMEALADEWIKDLTEGMEGTPIRAGFIKIAMSDDGPTAREVRSLRAAARASLAVGAATGGAAVASHTKGSVIAMRQMDILEEAGLDLNRFIWVHANSEPDMESHLRAAQRGAYVEFDGLSPDPASLESHARFTLNLIQAGFAQNILLSHDAGWYQPGIPDGVPDHGYRGYTTLIQDFMPYLKQRGVDDDTLRLLVHANPARAFAFHVG